MIEARVLKCYVDKYTGEQHVEGSVVSMEKSRAAELKALGAVDFEEKQSRRKKDGNLCEGETGAPDISQPFGW